MSYFAMTTFTGDGDGATKRSGDEVSLPEPTDPKQMRSTAEDHYAKYEKSAADYAIGRKPVGHELLQQRIQDHKKEKSTAGNAEDEYLICDFPTGTGNYLKAMASHASHITAVDYSEAMLREAKIKINAISSGGNGGSKTTFETMQRSATDPWPAEWEAKYDLIFLSQCLHHFENDPTGKRPKIKFVFKEVFRCLKPGGICAIFLTTPEQGGSMWMWRPEFFRPERVSELCRDNSGRSMKYEELKTILEGAQFTDLSCKIGDEPISVHYHDKTAPGRAKCRNSICSLFDVLTDEDLVYYEKQFQNKDLVDKCYNEGNASRIKNGAWRFVTCKKPSS